MTNPNPTLASWLQPHSPEHRLRRYCRIAACALAVIWIAAAVYVWLSPQNYISEFTLVLPDRSENSSLALSNIGSTSFSSNSPFGNIGQNPLLTYQKFATSPTVLAHAAELSGVGRATLGSPRIKLIPQTPLMEFQIKGSSPELAKLFGISIIQALNSKLDVLRQDELRERDIHRSQALETYDRSLARSRRDVLQHQTTTNLVTTNQFDALAISIEGHRITLTEQRAERNRLRGYLNNLYAGVGVDRRTARAAVRLQAREDLRNLLSSYAAAVIDVTDTRARVGARHPKLLASEAVMNSLETQLINSVGTTLNQDPNILREVALLSTSAETGAILRNMVNTSAELEGLENKVTSLELELVEMNERLRGQARSAAVLADLERDHSIAEAVFSSALGRISTEKFDVLSAYPLFQVFAEPTSPTAADRRPTIIAFVGAIGITGCVLIALIILWLREPMWQRLTIPR